MAGPGDLEALRRLARLNGVEISYRDLRGERQDASPESLLAVLRALGTPVESVAEAAEALRARRNEIRTLATQPVAVAWGDDPARHRLRLPAGSANRPIECRVELESGGFLERHGPGTPVGPEREGLVPVRIALPDAIPPGVHRMRLAAPGLDARVTLIAAPPTCFGARADRPRELGVFLPLYALVTERSAGTADLTDLADLAAWASSLGAGVVGTLPLLSAFLDEPLESSPYLPVSRLFWNELYADVTAAPELAISPAARDLLASADTARELDELRAQPEVDYRRAMALKRRVLDELAAAAFASDDRRADLEAFARALPAVDDYARFRAAVERHGGTWQLWDAPARDGRLSESDVDEPARRTHLYAQRLLHEQLEACASRMRENGSGLYLDLPIGVHGGGYDVWRHRDRFTSGASVGAPPDDFFTGGQNWGIPPLNPGASRADGHTYYRAVIANHLRFADILRIDHVMGLHRLFWIPDGMTAKEGVYVRYPAEELTALLCLESQRHRTRIVGENLGTVPPVVNRLMERHGLVKMAVGQFELRPDPARAISPVPGGTLLCMNTHDLPPFASYWRGGDLRLRREFGFLDDDEVVGEEWARGELRAAVTAYLRDRGLLDPQEEDPLLDAIVAALLREMAGHPADILMVSLEDLWLEDRPQNVPGIVDGWPSWKRKAVRAFEEFREDPAIAALLRDLAALRAGQ